MWCVQHSHHFNPWLVEASGFGNKQPHYDPWSVAAGSHKGISLTCGMKWILILHFYPCWVSDE